MTKLGLVCMSKILSDNGGSFKTMRLGQWKECENHAKWKQIVQHNVQYCGQILDLLAARGEAQHYRFSSSMMPLDGIVPQNLSDYFHEQVSAKLAPKIAALLSQGYSFSTHPDHFVKIASDKPDVVKNSIGSLEYHAKLHDSLGLPKDYSNPINIHIGVSHAPSLTIDRVKAAFDAMSDSVRSRLVFENDDKGIWNCDTLHLCFGDFLPLTYDNLHDKVLSGDTSANDNLLRFAATWLKRGFQPIFHWSEGKADDPRAHADFPTFLPEVYNSFSGVLECEFKDKDLAVSKCKKFL